MRIVFMGTPDFAAVILDAVHAAGHEILAAVTQPDRPKGRGKAMAMSDVKMRAMELGIPVLQPERVRNNEEFAESIRTMHPDVICYHYPYDNCNQFNRNSIQLRKLGACPKPLETRGFGDSANFESDTLYQISNQL